MRLEVRGGFLEFLSLLLFTLGAIYLFSKSIFFVSLASLVEPLPPSTIFVYFAALIFFIGFKEVVLDGKSGRTFVVVAMWISSSAFLVHSSAPWIQLVDALLRSGPMPEASRVVFYSLVSPYLASAAELTESLILGVAMVATYLILRWSHKSREERERLIAKGVSFDRAKQTAINRRDYSLAILAFSVFATALVSLSLGVQPTGTPLLEIPVASLSETVLALTGLGAFVVGAYLWIRSST